MTQIGQMSAQEALARGQLFYNSSPAAGLMVDTNEILRRSFIAIGLLVGNRAHQSNKTLLLLED